MEKVIKAANKWIEKHPYLKDIAALYLASESAVSKCAIIENMPEITEKVKDEYMKGVSLLNAGIDLDVNLYASKILLALSTLKDNADIPEQVTKASEKVMLLSNEKSSLLISSVMENNEDEFKKIATEIDIEDDILKYFVWVSIRKALSGIKDKLETFISENTWQQGKCPVCGNMASSAFFKHTKRGRQRFLHCEHCGTEWAYKRIGCPYCENIDQKKLSIKDSENEPDMRIDLCHKCMSYIKTYIGEDAYSVGKESWAGVHLDILMKDTGFTQKGSLVKP